MRGSVCNYMCAHTCVSVQTCLCDSVLWIEWVKGRVCVPGLGERVCKWTCVCEWMRVRVCAPVWRFQNLPPLCPVTTSREQSSCSPGRSQLLATRTQTTAALAPRSAVLPHPQLLPGVRPPSWQRRTRLPFLQGPEGRWQEGGLRGAVLRGGSPERPSVLCLPLSPLRPFPPQGASLWRPLGTGS